MAPSHSDEVEFPRGSYERGHYVGEQRALNRLLLGLPVNASPSKAERELVALIERGLRSPGGERAAPLAVLGTRVPDGTISVSASGSWTVAPHEAEG